MYNGMIDKHPAAIAAAGIPPTSSPACGSRAPTAPRLPSAAAATTRPASACADGALVIDLSLLRSTTVNPEDHTVRVDAGCTWGDVDHATVAFGMATPSGFLASTGWPA